MAKNHIVENLRKQIEKFQSETLELFGKMFESRITSFEDQLEKIETV